MLCGPCTTKEGSEEVPCTHPCLCRCSNISKLLLSSAANVTHPGAFRTTGNTHAQKASEVEPSCFGRPYTPASFIVFLQNFSFLHFCCCCCSLHVSACSWRRATPGHQELCYMKSALSLPFFFFFESSKQQTTKSFIRATSLESELLQLTIKAAKV